MPAPVGIPTQFATTGRFKLSFLGRKERGGGANYPTPFVAINGHFFAFSKVRQNCRFYTHFYLVSNLALHFVIHSIFYFPLFVSRLSYSWVLLRRIPVLR